MPRAEEVAPFEVACDPAGAPGAALPADSGAVYRWELRERLRYYEVRVSRDLFGATIFARSWGTIGSPMATTYARPLEAHLLPGEVRRIGRERGKLGFKLTRAS